jgi:hypothetical protein
MRSDDAGSIGLVRGEGARGRSVGHAGSVRVRTGVGLLDR